ncbi:Fic family protein [Bacillus wiedmannii]|uniref:Fic family protein n=1 Tax=Bacillus wiedmannii TaxID=1890302 RepID=UPI000B441A13|nr:Fic family protein [Bacillus wiedmannii]OUB80935.1 cell filamentation protein Fic [Bacillus thuringiensis serovar sinensis]
MRNFFEDTYMNINFKKEFIHLISEISEYKGKLSVYQSQRSPILNNLEGAIPFQYIKNFIKTYEDINVPNKRLKSLILNDIPPKTTAEDAVYCYNQTLSLVHRKFNVLTISPETIQELHFQLLNYNTSNCGIWRQKQFNIPGVPKYEENLSGYRLHPYELIPEAIKDLCDQYNSLSATNNMDSLSLIARFLFNFYCIVPFDQGNGRLALIMLQLLLMQNGHTFIKYICLDKYIKKSESSYFQSVYKSSANWYCGEHNISFWLKSFLAIILESYHDLNCILLDSTCQKNKVERIKNFILQQKHTFTKEDIRNAYPSIAESTIGKALTSLQLSGRVKLASKGRNARWIKINKLE